MIVDTQSAHNSLVYYLPITGHGIINRQEIHKRYKHIIIITYKNYNDNIIINK